MSEAKKTQSWLAGSACWIIQDEKGHPLRNGVSFNNEDEAWRCYFSNRSDWQKWRDYCKKRGYICVFGMFTQSAPDMEKEKVI